MSKYGVIYGPYFPVFGLNTKIYGVNKTRNNSVFGYHSGSGNVKGFVRNQR